MSLDGYIAGPKEDLSWLEAKYASDIPSSKKKEPNPYDWEPFFASVGAIIMGRNTYDLEMRNGWADAHPVPKFILTSKSPDKRAKKDDFFTNEDIGKVLQRAKKITDKNIWIEGGASIVRQFIKRDLLDEIILFIAPVLLGSGIRLFGDLDGYKKFRLRNIREYGNAMVQIEYTRKNLKK